MADLGDDFSCVFDIDWNLTEVSGRLAVAQAVARRWITFPGTLFYDPTYGFGLELYLNEPAENLGGLSTALENEALKDERVAACSCVVTADQGELSVRATLEDDDGPFTLVVTLPNVTVQLLNEENG